jgi:anaerobic magnesium-protoporphyrin IX monomethyl ester cyclase
MKILLTTLHAKYVHSSLALPYLATTCSQLSDLEIEIVELTVNEQHDQLLWRLFKADADVILFSCYIWNTELSLKLASDLKQISPTTFIVLGGPEVSFGAFEMMVQHRAIDCIVRGEGEETCSELLRALQEGTPFDEITGLTFREGEEIVANPDRHPISLLDTIPSPFSAGLADLEKPLVYYETSRGCPFSCAFCMSSIESGVRSFSMERIKQDLGILLERRVQTVKFVDRTFNFNAARANEIWRYILEHNCSSKFHFEIAADLLTDDNLALLAEVPEEMFRFEIGVQSGAEETLAKVERKSSLEKVYQNVRRLKEETRVTVHLDLVAGLPGESLQGFLASLQSLFSLNSDHVQVEALKVMKGTRMRSIARKEHYAYQEAPPYKVLRTPWLSFPEIRRIDTISRLVDLIYNSGRFATFLQEISAISPLSDFFAAAAPWFEEREIPSNLALGSLFGTIWRFAVSTCPESSLPRLRDALTYDFLLLGYPGGSLPEFFEERVEKQKSLPVNLPAARPGERLRYYRRHFPRDYRVAPWPEIPAEITFVYRSAPGAGLKVEIL